MLDSVTHKSILYYINVLKYKLYIHITFKIRIFSMNSFHIFIKYKTRENRSH